MLPKLLAGPILRRADREAVFVWLATSEPLADPALEIYRYDRSGGRPRRQALPVSRYSSTYSFQCGAKLYLHMLGAAHQDPSGGSGSGWLRLDPEGSSGRGSSPGLPVGEVLGYDIRYDDPAGGSRKHLSDLGTLRDFVYPPYDLPTFLLQPDRSTRFTCLYGSCRKTHGYGADAIEAAHRVLARRADDISRRPHVLLLGGDQIYADDVADVMIRPIQQLAREIAGGVEPLPGIRDPSRIPIRGRATIVRDQARYTSTEAENHLMTFSEFAATYLLAWNPDLWPTSLPGWSTTYLDMEPRIPFRDAREEIEGQRRRVLHAKTGAESARRVLANVPTYMCFDDHEITDDWYLSNQWKSRVRGAALGRRLLANGMAAFWAFQAWGNDPGDLTEQSLIDALMRYVADPSANGSAYDRAFLGFQRWSFRTPTRPSVVMTNTRTRRDHIRNRLHYRFDRLDPGQITLHPAPADAPALFDRGERARLSRLIREARSVDPRLVLVTPTPVYGLESMEAVQDAASSLGVSGTTIDNESFHADPNSFVEIIQRVLGVDPRLVVFLSGDVHYGFTVAAKVERRGRQVPVAQFTSSATKNETHGGMGVGLRLLQLRPAVLRFLRQTRHWWRPYAGAGSTLRIGTFGFLDAQANAQIGIARLFHGSENFLETSEFIPRTSHSLTSLQELIEMTNNIGHLQLRGGQVHHQLWRLRRQGAAPQSSIATHWTSWPV